VIVTETALEWWTPRVDGERADRVADLASTSAVKSPEKPLFSGTRQLGVTARAS
jgi:hypothetical protein